MGCVGFLFAHVNRSFLMRLAAASVEVPSELKEETKTVRRSCFVMFRVELQILMGLRRSWNAVWIRVDVTEII